MSNSEEFSADYVCVIASNARVELAMSQGNVRGYAMAIAPSVAIRIGRALLEAGHLAATLADVKEIKGDIAAPVQVEMINATGRPMAVPQ